VLLCESSSPPRKRLAALTAPHYDETFLNSFCKFQALQVLLLCSQAVLVTVLRHRSTEEGRQRSTLRS
jgi:hypothetical protein